MSMHRIPSEALNFLRPLFEHFPIRLSQPLTEDASASRNGTEGASNLGAMGTMPVGRIKFHGIPVQNVFQAPFQKV